MTCNESDEQSRILDEICILENRIAGLDSKLAELLTEKKFANHRLSDLQYRLREIQQGKQNYKFGGDF